MHAHRNKDRQECENHHDDESAAHREKDPCYGTDPDEQPEPGRTIRQTERQRERAQGHKQHERRPGPCTRSCPLAHWMRPHKPGVAGCKEYQGNHACGETQQCMRLANQRDQGKEETDEPRMLVESPEMEGESAGSNHFICRLRSTRIGGSPCLFSCSLAVLCLHTRGISFSLMGTGALFTPYSTTSWSRRSFSGRDLPGRDSRELTRVSLASARQTRAARR